MSCNILGPDTTVSDYVHAIDVQNSSSLRIFKSALLLRSSGEAVRSATNLPVVSPFIDVLGGAAGEERNPSQIAACAANNAADSGPACSRNGSVPGLGMGPGAATVANSARCPSAGQVALENLLLPGQLGQVPASGPRWLSQPC
jgi:hypothetical protein